MVHPGCVASGNVDQPNTKALAGRYAALTRSRPADDPELIEVRSALARERVRKEIVASGHLLTVDDRRQLVEALLTGGTAG